MTKDTYSLEILFDGSQITLDDLRKESAKAMALNDPKSSVDWQVTQKDSQYLKLSVRGSLEHVDNYHHRLNDNLVNRYSFIRLRDEAGDDIREQAYPILARIEQGLRTFINRAMTEVEGFDWWYSKIPQRLQEEVQNIERRIGKSSYKIHHPLELATFELLVTLFAKPIQQWSENKSLSVTDLLEILSDCSSINEIQERIEQKTRKISLWDEVFARYFEKCVDRWEELKKTIDDFVIPTRNKVMHHRPMHRWELNKLKKIEQEVCALLASAKKELSEEERVEAHQIGEEWSLAWVRTIDKLARPLILDAIEETARRQTEMLRAMEKAARSPILDTIGETARRQTEMLRAIEKAAHSPMLDAIEEAARRQTEMLRAMKKAAHSPMLDAIEKLASQQAEWLRTLGALVPSNAAYVGSTESVRFHLPSCRYASRIVPKNTIYFTTREEALTEGYIPCETCKP